MKITDIEVIRNGEQELIDSINGDLDWESMDEIFRKTHRLEFGEDVEYKNDSNEKPTKPHTKKESSLEYGYRIEPFPDYGAAQICQNQNKSKKPVACKPAETQAFFQVETPINPGGCICNQVHRTGPATVDPAPN